MGGLQLVDGFAGRHLIMDVTTSHEGTSKIYHVDEFLRTTSQQLDMTLVYPPLVSSFPFSQGFMKKVRQGLKNLDIDPRFLEPFEKEEDLTGGVTGVTIWTESHCSFHSWPKFRFFSLDIYSCKEFDIDLAIKIVQHFFLFDRAYVTDILRFSDKEPQVKSWLLNA